MLELKKKVNKVINRRKLTFTLEKICDIIGVSVPDKYFDIKDKKITELNCNELSTSEFDSGEVYVLFDVWPNINNKSRYFEYINNDVIIFSSATYLDNKNQKLPVIHVVNGMEAWYCIGRYIKNLYKMPTIGITGTVGKTTTTLFAQCVFSEKYSVFTSGNNRNTAVEITRQLIKRYNPEFNFHIQETGGGRSKLVEESVRLIDADAFCITKINKYHHVDHYKNPDEIVYDKTSYDRYAKKNTVGVINLDDEELRNHEFQSKMITCGIEHEEADYTAKDIKQIGYYLTFTVCDNIRHIEIPIKIQIVGTHNVSNALLVFALAKHYGLTDEQIKSGFLKYKSSGIRQNIKEICGRTMYIDCFNVCADSIKSCLKTLSTIEIPKGCRKIAVLGGENALGENIYSVNYQTGCEIKEYDIDEFIFTGPNEPASKEALNYCGNGKAVFEGARTVVKNSKTTFTDNMFLLAMKLKYETKPGDLILFKGIFRVPLFAAIDIAFGTSFLIYNYNFKKIPVKDSEIGFTGRYSQEIDGVNIFNGVTDKDGTLIIPNRIGVYNVFRIGKDVFVGRKEIKKINFGSSLKNIGSQAFAECNGITELVIPENVIYIEESAFRNCKNLKSVIFKGVQHIEENAFKNCNSLESVTFIGDSCKTIEEGVFDGCSKHLKIKADKGTIPSEYAKSNIKSKKNFLAF